MIQNTTKDRETGFMTSYSGSLSTRSTWINERESEKRKSIKKISSADYMNREQRLRSTSLMNA